MYLRAGFNYFFEFSLIKILIAATLKHDFHFSALKPPVRKKLW